MKAGWEVKRLGEVCTVIAGQSPEGKFYNASANGLPFYQGKKEFSEKYIGKPTTWTTFVTKEAEKDDVLMSVRAPVGPINFSTEKICIGRGLAAIRASDLIDKDFLFNFLLKHEAEIVGNTGAVFDSINKSQIESILIPTPSLDEQQRIVAILDQAFEGIAKARANAEQNLQNARALFESHLQSVFIQHGEEWVEGSLEDVVDEKCSLSYGIVQPGDEFENGLPIIRPTDLTSKFINLDGLKRINPDLAQSYSRTTLIGDELLLSVRGSTGVISIATEVLAGANVTRGIVPIRFKNNLISASFGYFLLTSGYVQEQIKSKTYGAALMQINIGDLRKIKVKYPSVKVQDELTVKLNELDNETQRLETLYQRKIACLDELKKSLLQQAFAGEL